MTADATAPEATARVAVIVAAYNAAGTIGTAVRSALAEPEVAEVVVVDDGSSDATAATAAAADDGSGRLRVVRQAQNRGPSAARNVAIAASTAPLIAVLDADDSFVPGRFARLLGADFDLAADDILFVPEGAAAVLPAPGPARFRPLTLAGFARANVPVRGRRRRELGFLHPVMRRAFLDAHAIRYDETMRLGEDFDLYARAMLAGGRFLLCDAVGYVAVERAGSLSAAHGTADLAAFAAADARLLASGRLSPDETVAVRAHQRSVRARLELRRAIDTRRDKGLVVAGLALLARPRLAPTVIRGVLADKIAATRRRLGVADRRPARLVGAGGR